MREIRPSGSEGGARFYPLFLPLSPASKLSHYQKKSFFTSPSSEAIPRIVCARGALRTACGGRRADHRNQRFIARNRSRSAGEMK